MSKTLTFDLSNIRALTPIMLIGVWSILGIVLKILHGILPQEHGIAADKTFD